MLTRFLFKGTNSLVGSMERQEGIYSILASSLGIPGSVFGWSSRSCHVAIANTQRLTGLHGLFPECNRTQASEGFWCQTSPVWPKGEFPLVQKRGLSSWWKEGTGFLASVSHSACPFAFQAVALSEVSLERRAVIAGRWYGPDQSESSGSDLWFAGHCQSCPQRLTFYSWVLWGKCERGC